MPDKTNYPKMKVEPAAKVTGFTLNLSAEAAKRLYSSIDSTLSAAGVGSASSREKLPDAEALYDLYDALYQAGVTDPARAGREAEHGG